MKTYFVVVALFISLQQLVTSASQLQQQPHLSQPQSETNNWVPLDHSRQLEVIQVNMTENEESNLPNATAANAFLKDILTQSQMMFAGTWNTPPYNPIHHLSDKSEGNLRLFLLKLDPRKSTALSSDDHLSLLTGAFQGENRPQEIQSELLPPSNFLTAFQGRAVLLNGVYRDVEVDINIKVNPLSDVMQSWEFTTDPEPKLVVENVAATVTIKSGLQLQNEFKTRVHLTIQKLDSGEVRFIFWPAADAVAQSLPQSIWCDVKAQSLEKYDQKISNFSFVVTSVVMLSFYSLMMQIKRAAQNHVVASSISLVSLCINLVWHFFYFSVFFSFSISGEYFQYLGLPAFWYFMVSFTLESRLFIICWKSHLTQTQLYDDSLIRRRISWFYIVFYTTSFMLVLAQHYVLYNPYLLLAVNSTLWVPQIIQNYRTRSRRGPLTATALSLCATQSFLPLYIKLCPSNMFEMQSDFCCGVAMLCCISAQIILLKSQQLFGARWFVPKEWRRNPNAYIYERRLSQHTIEAEEAGEPASSEELTCVICMNAIRFQVDPSGTVLQDESTEVGAQISNRWNRRLNSLMRQLSFLRGVSQAQTSVQVSSRSALVNSAESTSEMSELNRTEQSSDLEQQVQHEQQEESGLAPPQYTKIYLETPCNHSYHTVCLAKWMEIRLECPTCRQAIPQLDEDS